MAMTALIRLKLMCLNTSSTITLNEDTATIITWPLRRLKPKLPEPFLNPSTGTKILDHYKSNSAWIFMQKHRFEPLPLSEAMLTAMIRMSEMVVVQKRCWYKLLIINIIITLNSYVFCNYSVFVAVF